MSWFKVDDRMPNSRKVLSIPRAVRCAAIGLWSMAGAWCMDELTDGHLPKYMVEELAGTPELAEALVRCGLWYDEDDEYVFHDWADWQPSRDEVLEKREKNAARLRAWREQKARENDARNAVTNSVANTSTNSVSTLSPSRPVPTRPDPLVITTSTDVEDRFDEFWTVYPRKVSKKNAKTRWDALMKRKVDPDRIISGAKVYARAVKSSAPEHIKHPDGWLNGERWEDAAPTDSGSPTRPLQPVPSYDPLPIRGTPEELDEIDRRNGIRR